MNDSPTHSTISSDDSSGTVPRLMPAPDTENRPGFPTYAQYKDVEASYLNNMSHMKRPKALITQAMFDDIWDVLYHPKAVTVGTPQFRYWVRKMFTLSRFNRDRPPSAGTPDAADADTHTGQSPVVLHDGRPVAITEHLYEVLCYCHGLAEHGGRDKTCAVICEHYSWVPKGLTARFVKACPTCVEKKNRSRELVAQFLEQPLVRKQDVDDMSICSQGKRRSTTCPSAPLFQLPQGHEFHRFRRSQSLPVKRFAALIRRAIVPRSCEHAENCSLRATPSRCKIAFSALRFGMLLDLLHHPKIVAPRPPNCLLSTLSIPDAIVSFPVQMLATV